MTTTKNALLADILSALLAKLERIEDRLPLKGTVDRLEAATVELSREVQGLRADLREEEQARMAVGITVLDHEAKLSRIGGKKTNGT